MNQGAISTYTLDSVTANHTISAAFVANVSSIAALNAKPADALVKLTRGETVIYAPRNSGNSRTTTFFDIAETKGISGLKVVDKTSDALTLGNQVINLTGYVRKPAGGEVYLELTGVPIGPG